ncbi:hypothetical protein LH51_17735 [Nitrincola sp. A-D6]|nr:hypothetical protein LH51_17735 [Nitrincola sp. A-D6]
MAVACCGVVDDTGTEVDGLSEPDLALGCGVVIAAQTLPITPAPAKERVALTPATARLLLGFGTVFCVLLLV